MLTTPRSDPVGFEISQGCRKSQGELPAGPGTDIRKVRSPILSNVLETGLTVGVECLANDPPWRWFRSLSMCAGYEIRNGFCGDWINGT